VEGAARTPAVPRGAPLRLVALGSLALGVGALVYLADRDPSRAALVRALPEWSGARLFGALGLWLPSLVHPFAFSLFSAAVQSDRRSPAYWACALWWSINVAFELAQAPAVKEDAAAVLRQVHGDARLADALSNYLLRGTFDTADLIAATVGAAAAGALLHFFHLREKRDAR
jgi:hypothetical protein